MRLPFPGIALVVVAVLAVALTPARASAAPRSILLASPLGALPSAQSPGRPFSPTSFWNTPLPARTALDARSRRLVGHLVETVGTYGPWINTTQYSSPVYVVPPGQSSVRVRLDTYNPAMQEAFAEVPLPADVRVATGNDSQLTLWQPGTDRLWEFWKLHREPDGWHARWGGRMDQVSRNPGHFTAPHTDWGARATSLPLLGGLITIAELRSGRINHALEMGLPGLCRGDVVWPAQRTDGTSDHPDAIAAGTRLRLDPSLDLATLDLPPVTRMLAEAAQRYGIVVGDQSGVVTFEGEDPAPLTTNPYPGFYGGRSPGQLLRVFPWSRLQVLTGARPHPQTSLSSSRANG